MTTPSTAYTGLNDPLKWTLPAALHEHAERFADRLWLSDTHGHTATFREARDLSCRLAGYLGQLNLTEGARVALFQPGCRDFALTWLGISAAGFVSVMINTDLHGEFLRHQLSDSGVEAIFTDAALLPRVIDLLPVLPALRHVIVSGEVGDADLAAVTGAEIHRFAEALSAAPAAAVMPRSSGIASVMYTSGTSGPSKGVLMPHAHCALYGIGQIRCMEITSDDRFYICLPLFHANGLFMQLGASLLAGIPAHIRGGFSASNWRSDLKASGATVSNLIGSTAAFILNQPPSPEDRDHALRAVLASPNLPQYEAEFHERFGIRDVVSAFGMTESNIPTWGRMGISSPSTAGWAHEDHFTVAIVDPETDAVLPAGEVGEIVVRPLIPFGFMAGYLNVPEKTVEAWRNLWFHTGDAGVMDEIGCLTFIDRLKDCIRRRGENISATELELVVEVEPGVAEVAAYAVPSDIPGAEDEVMLAIVAQAGTNLDAHAVVAAVAPRLPRFARPRYVKFVDELPKTATGKVKRAELRKAGTVGATDCAA